MGNGESHQIQSSSDQVVFHTRTILCTAASHHDDRVLLHIVTCGLSISHLSPHNSTSTRLFRLQSFQYHRSPANIATPPAGPLHLPVHSRLFPHPTLSIPQKPNLNVPSPGIYAVITFPLLNRTLAIFRAPELGFFGFVVPTFRHTPFISGRLASAGDRSLRGGLTPRPLRMTWIKVHLGRAVEAEKARAYAFWAFWSGAGAGRAMREICVAGRENSAVAGRKSGRRIWRGMVGGGRWAAGAEVCEVTWC